MKKLIKITTVLCLLSILSTSASAYSYSFSSGADNKTTFDHPTQSDDFIEANPNENVRNNKDAAYTPPPYGVFSGDIPTDPVSLYHKQDNPSTVNTNSNVSYSNYPSDGNNTAAQNLPPVSGGDILNSTSVYSENAKILPLYYDDGSIGTLEFPRFGKTIKVYEGETLDNMKLGAGHFSSTSAWDGNCAIAAHNRGVVNNFGFLKDIKAGDKVIYTTKYGVRTYKVTEITQISETDTAGLAWSDSNALSLYTCVQNVAGVRIYVRCAEVIS